MHYKCVHVCFLSLRRQNKSQFTQKRHDCCPPSSEREEKVMWECDLCCSQGPNVTAHSNNSSLWGRESHMLPNIEAADDSGGLWAEVLLYCVYVCQGHLLICDKWHIWIVDRRWTKLETVLLNVLKCFFNSFTICSQAFSPQSAEAWWELCWIVFV